MSKTSVVPAVFLTLWLASPATAFAQDSCQLPPQRGLVGGHQSLVFHLGGIPDGGLSLHLVARPDGRADGMASITDGTSNTILIAERLPALACEDVNLDGFAGVTRLLFTLNDVHTGTAVPLILVPLDGEVDSDLEQMSIVLAGRTFVETVNIGVAADLGAAIGPRVGYHFIVTASAGEVDLGTWSKVSGLDVTVDVIGYRAGGGTITLHRAASSDSLLVKAWLQELAETNDRPTLEIALLDFAGEVVATWTFIRAYPVKWDISGFDASQSGVAIETLVIAYERVIVDRRR